MRSAPWSSHWILPIILCVLLCACGQAATPSPVIGTFTMFNRQAPYLIAAPHGEYDSNTNEIVYEFCERVRWDCLIAEGFRSETASINVNRPTEGASLDDTEFTKRANVVYDKYIKRIQRLSPRVRFYAEIHGHDHAPLRDTIDIASVGITRKQAAAIVWQFKRSLRAAGLSQMKVRIDVLQRIRYNATHARQFGVLSFISPALHIELPPSARHADRDRFVRVLAKVLPTITNKFFQPIPAKPELTPATPSSATPTPATPASATPTPDTPAPATPTPQAP